MQDSNNKDGYITPNEVEVSNQIDPLFSTIPPSGSEGSVSWSASEFVAHQKSFLWFALVTLATIILAAIVWILTKDKISTGTLFVVGMVLLFYGSKRPRDRRYQIDSKGIHIDERLISYDDLRSFSLNKRGAFSSVVLVPLKRFGLVVNAYYDPRDEQKIISILSSHIPMEKARKDLLDDLMWKIHF